MTKTRRLRSLVILIFVFALLFGAGVGLRLLVLNRIKGTLRGSLNYAGIRISAFPPSLVVDDVRSISASPFLTAREIDIQLSFLSLFSKERSVRVLIKDPVLRITETSGTGTGQAFDLAALPFTIERGIIQGGEIYYFARGFHFEAKGLKAVFKQKKDAFDLRVDCSDNLLFLNSLSAPLSGKIGARLEGRGSAISVRSFWVEAPGLVLKARGALSGLKNPEFELRTSLFVPLPLIADLFNLPFTWEGRAEGEGILARRSGRLSFRSDLTSRDLKLNSFVMGDAAGRVEIVEGQDGLVGLSFQKGFSPREFLDISFGRKIVKGVARGFHLDPIVRAISLPWPIPSPVWGDFSVEKGRLQVRAEFRDEGMIPAPGLFPFRGFFDVAWDGKRDVRVTAQKLETLFGVLEVDGQIKVNDRVQVVVRGEVSDVVRAREFAERVLRQKFKVPAVRGKGQAEISILGNYKTPRVRADFSLAPGGFDRFEAQKVSGFVEIAKNDVTGLITIRDPGLSGDIRLLGKNSDLDVRIHAEEVNLESVLSAFALDFPLTGKSSGDFDVSSRGSEVRVKGEFRAASVTLAGQPLRDIQANVEWQSGQNLLSFSKLEAGLYGGRIRGSGSMAFKSREYAIDLDASGFDFSSFSKSVGGILSFTLKGEGVLDQDAAKGTFAAKNIRYAMIDKADAAGDLEISFIQNLFQAKLSGAINPGGNTFSLSFAYPQPDRSYLLNLQGHVVNPDIVLPWAGVQGEANFIAEIRGSKGIPQISGAVDFKGPLFPIPQFPQALNDYSGIVFIQNNKASIRSLQANIGGGNVVGSGEIRFGKSGVEFLDIQAEAMKIVLTPLDRTRISSDGSLRLFKDATRFTLSGDFAVRELLWRRELSEKLNLFPRTSRESKTKTTKGFFDDLTLDIRVRAADGAILDNSFGKVQGRFDLSVTGNIQAPIILGDIEGLRGDVNFQDRKFRVLRARLSFFNPTAVEPYLDFQGETFLKDYRVTFSLSGLIDRLRPEFASSPPLPPEDVLALLALGESFKRTYSYDVSSQLGTGSLLSFQLSEEAKRRAERVFSLDRFRIDPFVMGASTEMTARLTVGKKISRNVMFLYSTNLTSQREEIYRLEWEFSEGFSLVSMRDERGRISFDAKIRKRF